jgi:hypothetical protein
MDIIWAWVAREGSRDQGIVRQRPRGATSPSSSSLRLSSTSGSPPPLLDPVAAPASSSSSSPSSPQTPAVRTTRRATELARSGGAWHLGPDPAFVSFRNR